MERFLERLSLSQYRNNMILKGGTLVAAMVGLDNRSTMDMDATLKNLLSNTDIQTHDMKRLRNRIVSSWDRVFLLEKEDNGWLYGKNDNKSIQATFWELRLDQVVKAEVFVAK